MRAHILAVIVAFLLSPLAYGAALFELHGILSASGVNVRSQPSWLNGGFGRLDVGAGRADDNKTVGLAFAQIGGDAYLTNWLSLHANTVARVEQPGYEGDRVGVIEAYADITPIETDRHRLRLRTGMFFLPTSRENVGPMWSSPYTITFSAWNTWVGEELRPIGAELEWRNSDSANRQFVIAGGPFIGNDTSGTLLAWRGWSLGSRMTTYGEVLPLPPLSSLHDPDYFGGKQRPDGTTPFRGDLDGRTGWTWRVRWQIPQRFTIQLTGVNNRGDLRLYGDEYSWYTDFLLLGSDLHVTPTSTIAAEVAKGETAMGLPEAAHVEAGFYTAYLLFSQELGRHRVSVRAETFSTDELDHTPAEDNSEHGSAWTLAYFFTPMDHLRLGAELVKVNAQRPAALQSGFSPDTDGRTLTVEARWSW